MIGDSVGLFAVIREVADDRIYSNFGMFIAQKFAMSHSVKICFETSASYALTLYKGMYHDAPTFL